MDYKKSKAIKTTITRNIEEVEKQAGNIYKAISVMSIRAEKIGLELRQEVIDKLEEFATKQDNLDEIFENREQIEISKFYERLPKPTAIALDEWVSGDLIFKIKEDNKQVTENI